ncbi:MAG: hypothetical protein K6C94_07875 [Candidatus Gastranaerophilales bacterium]|nr:hypothetical protein [Candidatus Gastranaerophilales bacterium]
MKSRIYLNMLFLFVVIISYICLLCFISNEGIKAPGFLPRHGAIDTEIMSQTVPIQKANFDEIQLNKNLIDVE